MVEEIQELTWMAGWRMRDLMVKKEISPVEVTRHFLDRITQLDSKLHTFITVVPEQALEQSLGAEAAILRGETLGPLHGVPLSIKDMFHVKGIRTTGGSLVFKDFVATEDSVYAERVRQAGAIILGKTNTPEFGLAGRTATRLAPECLNPWDTKRTPAGSSGGATASVAAGMSPMAVGSDGGGSIRLPAAFCGVFGLLPSNGRVPRHGGLGGTLFLSGVGPVARDTRDAALLLQVLAGRDLRDPTCMLDKPPDYLAHFEDGVEELVIAWTPDYGYLTGTDPAVADTARRAAQRLEDLGAHVEEPGLVLDDTREAMCVMTRADNYALFGRTVYDDPATRALLTPYARERYAAGRLVTGAEYTLALRARFRLIAQLEQLFNRYALIASPTVGFVAPRLENLPEMGMPPTLASFTEMVNFAGYTAVSVPCGFVQGLPVGLQLIAPPNEEALVLRASRALETVLPWTDKHPAVS
jgi:Asp-tRNA(Asn)/Glu-tRNA(Gln) amidotransferase A subunit family amidase